METQISPENRITINPAKMSGAPCIRDLRMPVVSILAMLGDGMTHQDILTEFPELEEEDIKQAIDFASGVVMESINWGKQTA